MELERTVCACEACRECCRRQPGCLVPADLPALADAIGVSVQQLAEDHLDAGRGALIGRVDARTGRCVGVTRIPTLVPKREPDGCCHWFKDGLCEVHAAAPAGCRYFTPHMDPAEGHAKSVWMHMRMMMDGPADAYAAIIAGKTREKSDG